MILKNIGDTYIDKERRKYWVHYLGEKGTNERKCVSISHYLKLGFNFLIQHVIIVKFFNFSLVAFKKLYFLLVHKIMGFSKTFFTCIPCTFLTKTICY